MALKDPVNIIKRKLGYPAVKLEIDDDSVQIAIDLALSKIAQYSGNTEIKNVQATECQKFEANTVIRVYNNDFSMMSTEELDVFTTVQLNLKGFQSNIKDYIINQGMANVGRNSINRGFKFHADKLYLYNYHGTVSVEYIPKDYSFDTLEDDLKFWCIKYAEAECKEMLGRIRGKYRSSNSPFEVDGETLLNEANDAKQNLIEELKDGYGFFMVDVD